MAINAANTTVVNVTIANGATTSDAASLTSGSTPVAIITPSSLTGTAFTLQASIDGATYYPVYDITGSAYSVPVGTSRYIALPPGDLAGVRYLKVVSGSTEAADRTIGIVARQVA